MLLECLEDPKTWMALNFLNFSESKTEVMVFDGQSEVPSFELGCHSTGSQLSKPLVSKLMLVLNFTAR